MIRDRIVLGIRDNHTRKKLLQEKGLDLQRCVDIFRASEKSNSQLRIIEEVSICEEIYQDYMTNKGRILETSKTDLRVLWFWKSQRRQSAELMAKSVLHVDGRIILFECVLKRPLRSRKAATWPEAA